MGNDSNNNSHGEQAKNNWLTHIVGLVVVVIIVFVIVISLLTLFAPAVGNVFSDLAPSL